ncbi:MAG: hypothetical protein QXX17_06825 [Conexivisphaerales archaeon]
MFTYMVRHEWNADDTDVVNSAIGQLIEKSRNNQLPKGVSLLGVMLSYSHPEAICVWEADRKETIEGMLKELNVPTRHTVAQYRAIYGLSKI